MKKIITTTNRKLMSKGLTSSFIGRAASYRSPNIFRAVAYNFLDGAAYSIWQATILQVLLFKLSNDSNTFVGWVAGVTGVAQICAALLGGYAGDRILRQTVCRTGAVVGLMAVVVSLYAVYDELDYLFYVAGVFWGFYAGFANPSSEALFADSVPSGLRAGIYTRKWIAQTLCWGVGYATTLVLFDRLGDHWHLGTMKIVMYVGLCLHPVAFVVLTTLKDEFSVKENVDLAAETSRRRLNASSLDQRPSNTVFYPQQPQQHQKRLGVEVSSSHCPSSAISMKENPSLSGADPLGSAKKVNFDGNNINKNGYGAIIDPLEDDMEVSPMSPLVQARRERMSFLNSTTTRSSNNNVDNADYASSPNGGVLGLSFSKGVNLDRIPSRCHIFLCWEAVPYYIAFADVLQAIGAGMTIRFFPLFFVTDFDVSPSFMAGVFLCTTIGTALMSFTIKFIAERGAGRIPTMIITRTIGASCLLVMALATTGPLHNLWAMVILFGARAILMNSTLGMSRSVIMDCVAKETRAKWSAIESLSSFSWAGSAALGGVLVDRYGYRSTFAITVGFQMMAQVLLIGPAICSWEVECIVMDVALRRRMTKKIRSSLFVG